MRKRVSDPLSNAFKVINVFLIKLLTPKPEEAHISCRSAPKLQPGGSSFLDA
jgi:hypothetical protein